MPKYEYRGHGNVFCGLARDPKVKLAETYRRYYEGEGFIGTGEKRKHLREETKPGKFLDVPLNYTEHIKELGLLLEEATYSGDRNSHDSCLFRNFR
mmetsp:Transcript_6794/g.11224  ORF Transcript_6794/g.11224 Transcript_6794/m.11224 type:complete len:96 (-) Transcript_6794:48-335(-)